VRVCLDGSLRAVGAAARRAGPPVVAASSVGAWAWCGLKAWHNTSLFNAGWLPGRPEPGGVETRGLAVLWAGELAKKTLPRVIAGSIVHGEAAASPTELMEAARLARLLAGPRGPELLPALLDAGALPCKGLICPRDLEQQLRLYNEAGDLVEYSRGSAWPLVARPLPGRGLLIGVPDAVEEAPGGYRVVEVKTSSRPALMAARRGRSYRAAKLQLAAYAWILVDRWPLEEAVLVVKTQTGETVARHRYDPLSLADWFEEHGLPIAQALAAEAPPQPPHSPPCRSCEYGDKYPA